MVLLNIGPTVYAYDIREPDSPVAVAQTEPLRSGRIVRLSMFGDMALVATHDRAAVSYGEGGGTLHVIDVRPARPRPWWHLGTGSSADGLAAMPVVGTLSGLAAIKDMAVTGNTVVLATDAGLQVLDVVQPERPRLLSTVQLDNAANVVVSESLAVALSWASDSSGSHADRIRGYDIAQPGTPRELWSLALGPGAHTGLDAPLALADGRLFAIGSRPTDTFVAEYELGRFRSVREVGRHRIPSSLYDTLTVDDRGNLFLGFSRRPLMFALRQANLSEPRERYDIASSEQRRIYLSGSMLRQGARRLVPAVAWHDLQPYPNHVVVPELGLIDLTDLEAAKMLPGVQLLNDSVDAVSARNGLVAIATRDKLRIAATQHLDVRSTVSATDTTLLEWSNAGSLLYRAGLSEDRDGLEYGVDVIDASDPEHPHVTRRFPLPGQPVALADTAGEPFAIVKEKESIDTSLIQLSAPERALARGTFDGPTALAGTADRLYYAAGCDQSAGATMPPEPAASAPAVGWSGICLHALIPDGAGRPFRHTGSVQVTTDSEIVAMVAVNRSVFLLDMRDNLYVADVTDAATPTIVVAAMPLNTAGPHARLLANGGMLYVVTDEGRITALDISHIDQPRVVVEMPIPGGVFTDATLDEGQLIVSGGAQGLWFLNAPATAEAAVWNE